MRLSKEEQAEEVVPLKAIHGGSSNKSISRSRAGPIQRLLGILTVIAAVALIFVLMEKKEDESIIPSDIESQNRTKIAKKQCPKFCKARLAQRISHQGGDLLHSQDLLVLATKAREELIKTLKQDYGEDVFKAMFEELDGTSRGYTAFWGAGEESLNQSNIGPSKARFRRKLKMKLLEVQSAVLKGESSLSGCNCVPATTGGRRLQNQTANKNEVILPELPRSYSKFVWATGGHSAAAGHGNLYNESYTAYMERSVMNVFQAVGIDFVGRNYAMGGMSSGPEIALCLESLFGIDVDLISWDFGMTDGGNYWKMLLYANRIGMHRNKPAAVAINIGEGQMEEFKKAENQGISAIYFKDEKWQEIQKGIPDMFGMSEEQMSKIAPFARDFKCKDALEKGDPTCDDKKYSDGICPDRQSKASWHPGWRVQATYGNIMALFLSDMLIEAIKELVSEPYDPAEELISLLAEEEAEYATFYSTPPPITEDFLRRYFPLFSEDAASVEQFISVFHKNTSICHTALLPAEIRYLGILTETDMVGTHGYEKGISEEQADAKKAVESEKDKRQMRLTYESATRQPNCPVDLKWDYKDFFYSTQSDGWTSLTVPNKAEIEYYIGQGAYEPEGVIMLCFMKCDWGRCPEGEMQWNELMDGNMTLQVNGLVVTNFTKLDECGLLQHGTGDYHFKANSNGMFEFRVLIGGIAEQGKREPFARITTIVVM